MLNKILPEGLPFLKNKISSSSIERSPLLSTSSQYSSYLDDIYAHVYSSTSGNFISLNLLLSNTLLSNLIGDFSLSVPHYFLHYFRNLGVSPCFHWSFSDLCRAVIQWPAPSRGPRCYGLQAAMQRWVRPDSYQNVFMSGVFLLFSLLYLHT